jgi:hypothetical protein
MATVTVKPPHGPEDSHPLAVPLDEAAQLLGLTEATVLMRVFQRSLPSSIDRDGVRRVPREAIDSALTRDGQQRGPRPDMAALPAEGEGWWSAELRDARERIAALESQASDASAAPLATVEALAGELRAAQARITALESHANQQPAPSLWSWLWTMFTRLIMHRSPHVGETTPVEGDVGQARERS